jgi:voltage-gated potassium channel
MLQSIHDAFHDTEKRSFWVTAIIINILIVISVTIFFLEMWLETPSLHLQRLDRAIVLLFVVEITVRLMSWQPNELRFFKHSRSDMLRIHLQGRLKFALEPLNIIDIITILTFIPWLRAFRALRLLRLARSAALLNYPRPLEGIERSFRDDKPLFISAFALLGGAALIGGFTIFLLEAKVNPNISTIGDGIWWALVTLTTVGFGDISPVTTSGRLVGGVLMISGMFMLALFAGIISHTLLQNVLSIREEQFRMRDYIDHLVICGYDPSAQLLFDALLEEPAVSKKRAEIVVFAPGDRPKEIPEHFVWVPGDPTKESELDKVRLPYASAVIIVGSRACQPQDADAKTILTAFTIRSHLEKQAINAQRNQPVYVVAEILDRENVSHARTAGADEVIETTRLGFTLIAHAVHMPGTANVITEVASANATSLFVSAIFPRNAAEQLPFSDIAQALKEEHNVMVIGYKNEREGRDILNPPLDTVLSRGTSLIYIAGQEIEQQ